MPPQIAFRRATTHATARTKAMTWEITMHSTMTLGFVMTFNSACFMRASLSVDCGVFTSGLAHR